MAMSTQTKNVLLMGLVLASLLALAWSAPVKGGDWASFTLNNNNSRYQANSTINASNIAGLAQKWQVKASDVSSTPIVVNGSVYFSDWNGSIYSVNVLTGNVNWHSTVKLTVTSTPAVANGMVFVAYGPFCEPKCRPAVVALSQKTGNVVWNNYLPTTMNELYASPIIYNGMLYVGVAGDYDTIENSSFARGQIYALNESTGHLIWTFNTTIPGGNGGDGIWGSVAIDPKLNSIYFATGNPYLNASGANTLYGYAILSVNASNGRLNWYRQVFNNTKLGMDNDFGSTPNLFNLTYKGKSYYAVGVGNKNGIYYILDRTNGKFIENISVGTESYGGIIGLAGVLNQNTADPELFIPAFYNTSVNGDQGGIVKAVFPATNTVAWAFRTPGDIIGSVSLVPGAVLVGDNLSNFYALNITNGAVLYHKNFDSGILAGITPAEGYIFVPLSSDTNITQSLSNHAYGVVALSISGGGGSSTTTTTTTSVPTTTTTPTTTIPSSCSGTPSLALIPNPANPSSVVTAAVSGLSGCSGITITIKDYEGCTSGATIATFIGNITGGITVFESPGSDGQYGYYACVNSLTSAKAILTVSAVTTTIPTTSTTTTTLTTTSATTSTALSSTTTLSTTTIPAGSCSGTPILTIGPNPAPPSDQVSAGVSGLTNCNGNTITIKDYEGCTSGATIATFISASTGGLVNFTDPTADGSYGYYACVNGKNSTKYVLTVAPSTGTSTTTTTVSTTTTSTTPTTTIPGSCSGTPSLALSPNPAGTSSTVNATVSGLSGCSGMTITIKDYEGCSSGATIGLFIGTGTGGSLDFTSPSADGSYGYYACADNQTSTKTILTVN